MSSNIINRSSQSGLSLIEVLIALILIGVALIGLASLQTTSLQRAHDAHFRSQASVLAKDLMERIKSNDAVVKDGDYVFADVASIPAAAVDCATNACTPQQMAAYDLDQWQGLLDNSPLPAADASVSQLQPGGSIYQIRVFWNEDRTALAGANPNCDPTAGLLACFQIISLLCANQNAGEPCN